MANGWRLFIISFEKEGEIRAIDFYNDLFISCSSGNMTYCSLELGVDAVRLYVYVYVFPIFSFVPEFWLHCVHRFQSFMILKLLWWNAKIESSEWFV